MIRLRSMFIVICGALFFGNCAEVIDLGTEFGPTNVLIYGRVTTGTDGNLIELATTSPFNAGQTPLGGARITLVAENGDREPYVEIEEGLYQLFNDIIIAESGKQYHIEMTLPSGEAYKSEPAVMPEKKATDSLDWVARLKTIPVRNGAAIQRKVVELFMGTTIHDPEDEPLLRWNFLETYLFPEFPRVRGIDDPPLRCYDTNNLDIQNLLLYDGSELNATEIPRRLMVSKKHDSLFVDNYWFHAVQSSLTPDAFRFWKEIDKVANAQGSIFDTPLGPIRSNVFNVNDPFERVLGYFEVTHVDTTRISIDDNDIQFLAPLPCRPSLLPDNPQCLDCLLIEGATKDIPYWVD